ncbi:unnamed protein product [Caenorhabditis auriculariae]|uniref:Ras-associating domain-containing protein n=1 Tax=Caenorhabditis auriculariae TaxID=2777116 RepID=A0A8S1GXF4_9PELO|nr:unnamed protein product [Caenorhabditis auriculariae]
MKSKRSLVRAILFVLRLQKNVSARHRSESRRVPNNVARPLVRCESTKNRRRSSHKCAHRHRNSAPSSSFPLRTPQTTSRSSTGSRSPAEWPVNFGVYSGMSQPYSIGLDDSRGKPLISVCAGAAHTLASTALLCRQQSLDEPATRALEKVATSPLLRGISVQRQGTIEPTERKKNGDLDERLQRKAVKTNMITMYGAILAIEQGDSDALTIVLEKNQIDVNSPISTGPYQQYSTRWTLLDVAINLNHADCVHALQKYNAVENFQMNTIEKRKKAVLDAIHYSEAEVASLRQGAISKENEKHLNNMVAHIDLLRKMKAALDSPKSPDPLFSAKVEALSNSSAAIHVIPHSLSDIVLKYKIEWSVYPDFEIVFGLCVEPKTDMNTIIVKGLESSLRLIFRISVGGVDSFSAPITCSPGMIEISAWQDVDNKRDGWSDRLTEIENLTNEIEKHRQSLVWQRVFLMTENGQKRKKNGLKELFSASSKFSKNASRGVYLASLVYTEGKVLCTVDDCIPILPIDESVLSISKDDHHWLMKMSRCWDQVGGLMDTNPNAYANNISLSLRTKLINAAVAMQHALGIRDIGHLHYLPITYESCTFLLTVRFLDSNQQVQGLTLRWLTFEKLLRKKMATPAIDMLTKETVNILNFFESSQIPLRRGLYLCYLKLHSSLNSIRVVVPDNLPSILPFVNIRDNPHITKEEWQWIKSTDFNKEFQATRPQIEMHKLLSNALTTLLHDLDIDSDLVPGHRLYHTEIIQPSNDVSMILVLPRSDEVCSAPTGSVKNTDFFEQRRGCSSIPIPVFEMIHLYTYQPQFISTYCRLSIFLEHFLMISQYEQRKCLLENDAKVYRSQCEILTDFQKRLDEIWQSARWISRIALEARDKHVRVSRSAIPLGRLLAPLSPDEYTHLPSSSSEVELRPEKAIFNLLNARPRSLLASPQGSYRNIDSLYRRRKASMDARFQSQQSTSTEKDLVMDRPLIEEKRSVRGNIVVCVAYDCGLSKGSKVPLSISGNTTAQEVVSLVLEQVAKATVNGEEEINSPDESEFCLVSIVGHRERRLKPETALLRVQNPWVQGNLFVRKLDDLLAAVEYGNESPV